MAELLANPDVDMTVKDMCEQIGVSRNAFYIWQKEPAFRGYVNYLIDSYTDSELANVWRALIKKATLGGDVQAQKLYFELKEKYKQKLEIDGNVVIFSGENELKE